MNAPVLASPHHKETFTLDMDANDFAIDPDLSHSHSLNHAQRKY